METQESDVVLTTEAQLEQRTSNQLNSTRINDDPTRTGEHAVRLAVGGISMDPPDEVADESEETPLLPRQPSNYDDKTRASVRDSQTFPFCADH